MNLSELQKGECGKIIKITSDNILKARFSSFGITKGAIVYVIGTNHFKKYNRNKNP